LDRFIVKDSVTEEVWWGWISFEPAAFEALYKSNSYLSNKEVFVRDSYVCADPNYRLNVRVLTETPWANLFCYNMFLRPEQELEPHQNGLTMCKFPSRPCNWWYTSKQFCHIRFQQNCTYTYTGYTGENEKIFSALNFILPEQIPYLCTVVLM
jgi:phosphoenolpyruvate carboxykinase (ATP)